MASKNHFKDKKWLNGPLKIGKYGQLQEWIFAVRKSLVSQYDDGSSFELNVPEDGFILYISTLNIEILLYIL